MTIFQGGASDNPGGSGVTEKVVVRRLDTEWPQEPKPRLIKVDVEGAERVVFRGGAKTIGRCRPCLIVKLSVTQPQRLGYHPLPVAWMEARGDKGAWLGGLERPFCEADPHPYIDVAAGPEETGETLARPV